MKPTPIAPDVWALPFPGVLAYLVRVPTGFVLVDSGPPGGEAEILDALRQLGAAPDDLREIVLTHAHNDHAGSAAALARATGARVLAGADDAAVISGTAPEPPLQLADWEVSLHQQLAAGIPPAPSAQVDVELADGAELDWGVPARVLHIPGHTPGSIAIHVPDWRMLFAGDTVAYAEEKVMLGVFNVDRAKAAESFRRLATLDVETAAVGHLAPLLTGAGDAIRAAAREMQPVHRVI